MHELFVCGSIGLFVATRCVCCLGYVVGWFVVGMFVVFAAGCLGLLLHVRGCSIRLLGDLLWLTCCDLLDLFLILRLCCGLDIILSFGFALLRFGYWILLVV